MATGICPLTASSASPTATTDSGRRWRPAGRIQIRHCVVSVTSHARQLTDDYDARYLTGDTPWEDPVVPPCVVDLVTRFVAHGMSVLDVGCGLGTTARWLQGRGLHVTVCDISADAIRQAQKVEGGAGVRWQVCDFTAHGGDLGRFDVVIDRGVLHTFASASGRRSFAAAVAAALHGRGVWLSVAGSADNIDAPGSREALALPRLSLADVADAVEDRFEFVSVERVDYGTTAAVTDFTAFAMAMRLRLPTKVPIPAMPAAE